MSDYRANTALGGSDLRAMVLDWEKWLFERDLTLSGSLPEWMQRSPTPAMEFGTLVHRALLEPWFHECDVVMPYVKSFALKEGKQIKAEAEAQAKEQGSIVIRHEHGWALEHIKRNFKDMCLENALFEVTPECTEVECYGKVLDIPIKGKLDWLHGTTLIDLKTISDWKKRQEVLFSSCYHVQLAHYESLLPKRPESLAIVWVESVAPYRVEFQEIEDGVAQMGRIAKDKAMQKYRDYLDGEVVF